MSTAQTTTPAIASMPRQRVVLRRMWAIWHTVCLLDPLKQMNTILWTRSTAFTFLKSALLAACCHLTFASITRTSDARCSPRAHSATGMSSSPRYQQPQVQSRIATSANHSSHAVYRKASRSATAQSRALAARGCADESTNRQT
jgi:hypothetical protein